MALPSGASGADEGSDPGVEAREKGKGLQKRALLKGLRNAL